MAEATEKQEHGHEAPGLPEIRDEAADTPLWVPVLGLSLLVLLALVFVVRAEMGAGEEPAEPETGQAAAQQTAEAEGPAEAEAEVEAVPAPEKQPAEPPQQ